MTTIEAYELTLSKVAELKTQWVEVTITPITAKQIKRDLKEGFPKSDLPTDKWVSVKLTCQNENQEGLLSEARESLSRKGIYFDTGFCDGSRDWELDWSFQSN